MPSPESCILNKARIDENYPLFTGHNPSYRSSMTSLWLRPRRTPLRLIPTTEYRDISATGGADVWEGIIPPVSSSLPHSPPLPSPPPHHLAVIVCIEDNLSRQLSFDGGQVCLSTPMTVMTIDRAIDSRHDYSDVLIYAYRKYRCVVSKSMYRIAKYQPPWYRFCRYIVTLNFKLLSCNKEFIYDKG